MRNLEKKLTARFRTQSLIRFLFSKYFLSRQPTTYQVVTPPFYGLQARNRAAYLGTYPFFNITLSESGVFSAFEIRQGLEGDSFINPGLIHLEIFGKGLNGKDGILPTL